MTLNEIETRKEEIEARMSEIQEVLEVEPVAETDEDLTKAEAQTEELSNEVEKLTEERGNLGVQEDAIKKEAESRKEILESIAKGNAGEKEERKNMEEKKFTVDSPEYRTAWAKTLMGINLDETDKRAVGDAVTTTSETYVASTSEAQGINNGGLLIPTSVRTDILGLIEKVSPFFRDVKKLAVAGNIDFPYADSADDASWQTELTDTKNEGIEFKKLSLTGYELAKNVVVTWKVEKMAVADFITFITQEIANKMGKAIVDAVIYGTGSGKPTGAIYGLEAVEGDDPIATIVATYKALDEDFRIGAKAYISTNVNIDIVGYKDGNDNYPMLNGLSATKLVSIEVDPYLVDGDIIVGNASNYLFNTVEAISVMKESSIVGRKTIYGSYGIFDGKPRTGAFSYGSYEAPESV